MGVLDSHGEHVAPRTFPVTKALELNNQAKIMSAALCRPSATREPRLHSDYSRAGVQQYPQTRPCTLPCLACGLGDFISPGAS